MLVQGSVRGLVQLLQDGRVDRRQFLRGVVGLGLSLGTASALLAACTPQPAAAPAQPPGVAKPDANAIDKMVELAKKEGEVTVAQATGITAMMESIKKGFPKKWGLPDSFKVNFTIKASAEVVNSVATEVQAGKLTTDMFWVAGVDLFRSLKQAGELMAYEPTDWASKYQANADKIGFETEIPYYYAPFFHIQQPMWNRDKIKKDIASYQDILELGPEVKGKLIVGDVRYSSSLLDTYVGQRTVLDKSFFQGLKDKFSPMLLFRVDEMLQKIAAGEADISMHVSPGQAYAMWLTDKKLNWAVANPKEGLVPIGGYMAILAKAPHPNAAKLMVEYYTSQAGMQEWVNTTLQTPLRTDYKVEGDLKRFMLTFDQVKWIALNWRQVASKERDDKKEEFRQTFGG